MNRRQRVAEAIAHRQPDKVPYHISFTVPAREAMTRWYRDPQFEALLGNCLLLLETEPKNSWKRVRGEVWEDQFGVQWDRTIDADIGTVCNSPLTRDNLATYPFPDPLDPSRFEDWAALLAGRPDSFVVANIGFSLFERAWTLAGMETVLMAMVDDRRFLDHLLDRILDFNLKLIEKACSFPIDAMRFGDDWGQQRGLIMGPVLWRELIGPRVRQMYSLVKSKGKKVFIHSCGKVDELFPDLIESGLDVFNPFQPEVMDVYEMKRRYGDRLSFFGGISTQKTLPYGTIPQVKEEVRRLLDAIGRNGGYIASPAHDIPRDAKPENIAAMIEVLQAQ
ncbi:MAG: uroporphyrinogen decarboxylase family protein [Spirochaetia bacterium]|jgi:uroporphyrinogen decarboxylase